MKKKIFYTVILVSALLNISCTEGKVFVNVLSGKDTKIPVLTKVYMEDDTHAVLVFDEKVTPFGNTFGSYQLSVQDCAITVTLPQKLEAGQCTVLSARVKDEYGNTTGFSVPLWGYNPNPADLLINELTFSSSAKQCRRTELYALSAGSILGMCLYSGSPSLNDCRVILPDIFVNEGSFIVIWWTDSSTFRSFFTNPEEMSSCLVARENDCYNICPEGGDIKFSSANGAQCLSSSPSPGAKIKDAVVWSAGKAEKYEGFGTSAVFDRVSEIVSLGGWLPSEVKAEYAADTSEINNASTRSLYRKTISDTDSSKDWSVTKSGQFTLGGPNS